MAAPRPLLLVALSARILAQSAARAGLRATAIDLFGDEDTCAAAERCVVVPCHDRGFDESALLAAVEEWGGGELVYGGGIDTRPDLLEKLMDGRSLLGNGPETLRTVKSPTRFFSLLDELAIPYPETRFFPPHLQGPWLVKEGGSEGGSGVRPWRADGSPFPEAAYFQRHLEGKTLSALFLAEGTQARIIGFNTLCTWAGEAARPFRFAGAVNRADLKGHQRETVADYATRLTRALGLVGLNGVDFMLEGSEVRLLELNPRPTATLQLHDADRPGGWLREHMAACRDTPIAGRQWMGPVRGFRIVFAEEPVRIAQGTAWPCWCADRPSPGAAIGPGEPLCTVSASGTDPGQVEKRLAVRTELILRLTASGET